MAIAAVVLLSLAGCNSAPGGAALAPTTTTKEASAGPAVPPASSPAASSSSTANAPAAATSTSVAGAPASSAALLAGLPVRTAGGQSGYSRDQFGPAWADVDHNGCDTRNDILNRDLTGTTWRAGTHECVVVSGTLADPYSGMAIVFSKAQASLIQIDHVVALGDAWSSGAGSWTAARREQFANDPLELLAVSGRLNESKGDANAAGWLPPNTAFTCSYVDKQIDIKATYGLSVTAAERQTMATVLARCGQTTPAAAPTPAAATPTPAATPTTTPAVSVSYANCAAVRAAGKAPLHTGDPGYRSGLDADHDGVACE